MREDDMDTVHANEELRNDPELKAKVAANLLTKAEETERILELITELKKITWNSRWGWGSRTRSAIFMLEESMENPAELRNRATNDTYLGNRTAFGHII